MSIFKAAAGNRWQPVHKGLTYCSPGCGAGCRRADYNKATEAAAALAKKLGKGWRPHVWENLGWRWSVIKGDEHLYLQIYAPSRGIPGWWIDSRLPEQFHAEVKTAAGIRNGIKLVLDMARTQAQVTLAAVESLK